MKSKRFSIPRRKKKGTLLIEFSEHLLKLVQMVEEKPRRKVIYLDASELDTQDETAISKQLTLLLKRLPQPIGQVFTSVLRSQITTRMFLLPSTQPKELARMVEFQIEKEIPFPKEKIIFDHHLIETTPEGYSRILLVIAGEEVIRRNLNILKKAGLVPTSVFLSSQGLATWFNQIQGEKEKEVFSVLIDIDLFLTHVEVLHRGELYFTRSFSIGSRQFEEKEEHLTREAFLQELNRTLVAFKKEFPPPIAIHKIFLSGVSKVFPTVQEIVGSRLTYPLETIDFKSRCPIETRFVKEGVDENISFSSGVGFLLRDEKRINLIPPAEKKARVDRMFRQSLTQFVSLVVGLLVLLGVGLGTTLHQRQETLLSLQDQLHALEPAATKIDTMQQQIAFLKAREEESKMILELLRELYRVVPQDVALTYLVVEPDHISLRGASKNFSTVFLFVKELESSPFFESVRPKNATRRVLSEGEVTIFQIDASVVREGNEEP